MIALSIRYIDNTSTTVNISKKYFYQICGAILFAFSLSLQIKLLCFIINYRDLRKSKTENFD